MEKSGRLAGQHRAEGLRSHPATGRPRECFSICLQDLRVRDSRGAVSMASIPAYVLSPPTNRVSSAYCRARFVIGLPSGRRIQCAPTSTQFCVRIRPPLRLRAPEQQRRNPCRAMLWLRPARQPRPNHNNLSFTIALNASEFAEAEGTHNILFGYAKLLESFGRCELELQSRR